MPGRTCTAMKYRPIGLPLRSRPRRCSSIAASMASSLRPPSRPRPRRARLAGPLPPAESSPERGASTGARRPCRRRRAPRLPPPDRPPPEPRRLRRLSAPPPAVSSSATGLRAGPGGGDVGIGIVSPILGRRTSARSAASTDGRPSRIGSGSSTSSSIGPRSVPGSSPMSSPSSSIVGVVVVDVVAGGPAVAELRRRCPPRLPRRRAAGRVAWRRRRFGRSSWVVASVGSAEAVVAETSVVGGVGAWRSSRC